ncbi:uncharacterized protein ACNLHF_000617 [Anomaloglossus baeobatrachus]|uniref:uncharacterized protein LOC142250990 n=1 Tax=Anomaloglossus baeobatrachus TaxID=238106 RepID=UPI003F50382E
MQIKGIFSVFLFVFLRCHLGSALTCYSCSGNCENGETAQCEQGQQCMTVETYSNGTRQDRQMGCQSPQFCNNPGDGSIVRKCCDQDRCNDPRITIAAAPSPDAPASNDGSREAPLLCYSCDYPCMDRTLLTCAVKDLCLTKTRTFAGITTRKRGCANTTVCGSVTTETVMGTAFSVTNKCCNTDLCNSVAHLEVPAVGILAAIVAVWISKLW